jgi:hypothetical protein
MDLLTAARFEAIGIASVTNALIACWDAKFTYMFWRPVTAIRAGDTDGNPETEPDAAWTPFIVTPPHPEYPAAHTTVGAAALGFYTVWFGTDQFQFPLHSRVVAARFGITSASTKFMPRKATRVCGAECTGATAPRWVPRSAVGSGSTRRRTF